MPDLHVACIALLCIAAVMGTGGSIAHAERITTDVPFVVAEQNCESYFDVDRPELEFYRCWFASELMAEDYQPTTLVTSEEKPAEVTQEETVVAVVPSEPKARMTDVERNIDRLERQEESGKISSADQILLDALRNMDRSCMLGIAHGERIQTFAEFVIPSEDPVHPVN